MPILDNPAGRLHDLLRRLSETDQAESILSGWAQVLEVPQDEVRLYLGAVGDLLPAVQEAVERTDSEYQLAQVHRYRGVWAEPIFPAGQAMSNPLQRVVPDDAALETLGAIAAYLHEVAPEGSIPEPSRLKELSDGVRKLIEEAVAADDLPDDVKHGITSHLRKVAQAIDHIAIGGPNAVAEAAETLVGSIDVRNPGLFQSKTGRRIAKGLAVVWFAFSAGPTTQASIEAWSEISRGELTSGAKEIIEIQEAEVVQDAEVVADEEPGPGVKPDGSPTDRKQGERAADVERD